MQGALPVLFELSESSLILFCPSLAPSFLGSLTSTLAPSRVRNYDLPTSLSVLRTGTYTRLPSVIREGFSQPEKLDDETVLRTLSELDGVLRWRLACVERIPSKMSKYWIADGRAWFRVEGMWEASFTYGGAEAEEEGEWYLLSLKFLFRVRDARGGELLSEASRGHRWEVS